MANRSYLNLEDELREDRPYNSVSDRVDIPDFISSSVGQGMVSNPVKETIAKKFQSSPPVEAASPPVDPIMAMYEKDQNDLNSYREAKRGADFIANMGQAFSSFSQGANAPKQNSGLFESMGKQSSEMLKSREEDLDRRQKIVNAIEARKARQEMEAGRREDRNLVRAQIQAGRDLARADKRELQAKLSEKEAGVFTDFDNALSDLKNLKTSLGQHSEWTGPIDGRVPETFVGPDQAVFRSALGKFKDAYRKAITGAGAGPTELRMLESRLPNEKDTFANFLAKLGESEKEANRHKSIYASNLSKIGKNVSGFVTPQNESSSSNKVIVSNGQETYAIDEADVANAEKDGFRRM